MPCPRPLAPLFAVLLLVLAVPGWGQTGPDPSRDEFLQTIGMLAGQGLVLGHESLEGIAARYEKKLMSREQALRALDDQTRYADWVLAAFKDRLMARLGAQEQKDLSLLIGFYETQREATQALAVYVRSGGVKNRELFQNLQARVGEVIGRISLGGAAP